MMAGSEILDGSSLMSPQLHLWEEIVLSSFSSSSFFKNRFSEGWRTPNSTLVLCSAHERPLGFHEGRGAEPAPLPHRKRDEEARQTLPQTLQAPVC